MTDEITAENLIKDESDEQVVPSVDSSGDSEDLNIDSIVDTDANEEDLNEAAVVEDALKEEFESGKNWYILQCYSGQEYKVQRRLNQLIEENVFQGKVRRVLIPEEETIEIRDNKRFERVAKIYPGYIFVEMDADDEVWFHLRKTAGISKVIGSKSQPLTVTADEILRILRKTGEKVKKIEVDFEKGEVIKVISGPFRGYTGNIADIYPEKGKLRTLISIFGRETPVELDFNQVEKAVK